MEPTLTSRAQKRQSLQAPPRSIATSPVQGRTHRRALSNGADDTHKRTLSGGNRTTTTTAHKRLSSAIGDSSDGRRSPAITGSSGSIENGDGVELDNLTEGIDRIRAPTRSTLNKQRRSISSANAMLDTKRRSATPGDMQNNEDRERLGLGHIPRAVVTHAVSMHDDSPSRENTSRAAYGELEDLTRPHRTLVFSAAVDREDVSESLPTPEPSPGIGRAFSAQFNEIHGSRIPSGPYGKSSRMIAALQAELEHTRTHLDRVKLEVRNCRREIGSLTRKSEDLRETRERMRAEAEAQNNLIQRKERLIAEVLARARSAEASLSRHVTERKELEADLKKTATESQAEVADARLGRAKAESERDALRDSVKSLRSAWMREVQAYREEVDVVQEQIKQEREAAAAKHAAIMSIVRAQAEDHKGIATLVEEVTSQHREATKHFEDEVQTLRGEVELHSKDAAEARDTARKLAIELSRLRRFARLAPREDLTEATTEFNDIDMPEDLTVIPTTPTNIPL